MKYRNVERIWGFLFVLWLGSAFLLDWLATNPLRGGEYRIILLNIAALWLLAPVFLHIGSVAIRTITGGK